MKQVPMPPLHVTILRLVEGNLLAILLESFLWNDGMIILSVFTILSTFITNHTV